MLQIVESRRRHRVARRIGAFALDGVTSNARARAEIRWQLFIGLKKLAYWTLGRMYKSLAHALETCKASS